MSAVVNPWDLYREAKAAKQAGNWAQVLALIDRLASLPPEARQDERLGNAVGWLIHYLGKFLLGQQPPDHELACRLVEMGRGFAYQKQAQPSAYAMLLRLALKVRPHYDRFLDFMDWWDLAHLQPADHQPYVPPGGSALPALAEQALLGMGKHLLAGHDRYGRMPQGSFDQIAMQHFVQQLGPYVERYPQHRFLPYLRAQLYLALEQPEAALADLQPFVRSHQKQPWAWDWLGRTYFRLQQPEAARACLAQALTLGQPGPMTVLTWERYARLCLEAGEVAQAKAALQTVVDIRLREWGRLPRRVEELMDAPWFVATEAQAVGPAQLRPWATQARALLYADLPEERAVVTGVNVEKGRVWYRLDRERQGNLKLKQLDGVPQEGDCLRLRVQAREGREELWYQALSARRSEEAPPEDLWRQFRGVLQQAPRQRYGFIGKQVFVAPPQMQAWTDRAGREIAVWALATYDPRKQRWGWQALRLAEMEPESRED